MKRAIQTVQSALRLCIDALFPPTEEALIVRRATDAELMHLMHSRTVGGVTVLFSFEERLVRALIHEAKFHANERAHRMLGTALARFLSERKETKQTPHLLIPVPLSPARERERGYNQVTEVIRHALTGYQNGTLEDRTLARTRTTKPQTSCKNRAERLTNVAGAFAVRRSELLTGAHVILIDDVVTTGATLEAAQNALAEASPASITLVALAH